MSVRLFSSSLINVVSASAQRKQRNEDFLVFEVSNCFDKRLNVNDLNLFTFDIKLRFSPNLFNFAGEGCINSNECVPPVNLLKGLR